MAVIVWVATASELIWRVVVPPLRVPLPSVVATDVKVRVPVGVPEPGAFAVALAVKVTAWPKTEGLLLELSIVVVGAWLPTCCSALDALLTKLPSPP